MASRMVRKKSGNLAEFRMRAFRIMLSFLGAGSPASRRYASVRLGKSVSCRSQLILDVSILQQKQTSHDDSSLTSFMDVCIFACLASSLISFLIGRYVGCL